MDSLPVEPPGRADCSSLLEGIIPNQGSNPGLPHCRQIFLPSELPEQPTLGLIKVILKQWISIFSILKYMTLSYNISFSLWQWFLWQFVCVCVCMCVCMCVCVYVCVSRLLTVVGKKHHKTFSFAFFQLWLHKAGFLFCWSWSILAKFCLVQIKWVIYYLKSVVLDGGWFLCRGYLTVSWDNFGCETACREQLESSE